jgi:hypothetical protein
MSPETTPNEHLWQVGNGKHTHALGTGGRPLCGKYTAPLPDGTREDLRVTDLKAQGWPTCRSCQSILEGPIS